MNIYIKLASDTITTLLIVLVIWGGLFSSLEIIWRIAYKISRMIRAKELKLTDPEKSLFKKTIATHNNQTINFVLSEILNSHKIDFSEAWLVKDTIKVYYLPE
jgi:hypothetical protein